MTPDIEIIPTIWQYSRLFAFQLSGFVLSPPRCRVLYRPCVTKEDEPTIKVLEHYASRLPASVTLEPHFMERRKLMRRAIGRNECCLSSKAPIVWCADVDYLATADCLDTILNSFPCSVNLSHPAKVHATSRRRGMELIEAVNGVEVPLLDLVKDFPVNKRAKAIGGLQFFSGEYARKAGYCNDELWNRIFKPANRWQATRCDRKARVKAGGSTPMAITALYRIRHWVRSEGAKEDAKL